jgi:hypothetical protein
MRLKSTVPVNWDPSKTTMPPEKRALLKPARPMNFASPKSKVAKRNRAYAKVTEP